MGYGDIYPTHSRLNNSLQLVVGGSWGFLALVLYQDVHHQKKVAISIELGVLFFFSLGLKAVKTKKQPAPQAFDWPA